MFASLTNKDKIEYYRKKWSKFPEKVRNDHLETLKRRICSVCDSFPDVGGDIERRFLCNKCYTIVCKECCHYKKGWICLRCCQIQVCNICIVCETCGKKHDRHCMNCSKVGCKCDIVYSTEYHKLRLFINKQDPKNAFMTVKRYRSYCKLCMNPMNEKYKKDIERLKKIYEELATTGDV